MASHIWIGGAPAVAQVDKITIPQDFEPGQVVNATIGVLKFSYTVPAGATFTNAISGLVNAWNSSVIPAVTEIIAVAEFTVETNPVPTGVINLTARTPGVPYAVTFTMGDGGNEIQIVTLSGTISGGTFTLTFDGQTTSNIAYNASAATVQTELRALSNIGVGDVVVTGSDGGPYTVEFQGALASTDVDLITANFTNLIGTNEQQTITLATGANGGTFTLTYGGATTAALAYNISAANLELVLEGLSGVGAGNVSVSGSGPWTVTFQNSLGKTDVGLITINDSGILGGLNTTVTPTSDGGGAINERFMISAVEGSGFDANFNIVGNASVTAGTFTLKVVAGGNTIVPTTAAIQWDATIEDIQDAIDAAGTLSIPTLGRVHAYGGASAERLSDGDSFDFQYSQATAGDGEPITVTITSSLTGGTYTGVGVGGSLSTNGVTIGTEHSFFITLGGQTTDDIGIGASTAQVVAALEALPNVGSGNVAVTGLPFSVNGLMSIELIGSLSNTATGWGINIGSNSGANGVGVLTARSGWTGGGGTPEVQTLAITGSPVSGTFSLEYSNQRTTMLAHNSAAAVIQAALEALPAIGSGNVVCTGGALPDTAVVITFVGALSGIDLVLITAHHGTTAETVKGGGNPKVTIATTQSPITQTTNTPNSGPNNWDISTNWNTNTVPVNGDTVYIADTDISILYGIDQSAVTLAALHIEQTFAGFIGLPRTNSNGANSYFEYRDSYLKIGATNLFIGDKEGDGSDRIKIDLGSVQSTVLITDSGDGEDTNTPAILLLGTHASNVININRGSLGVAYYPTEVSTISLLRQAFFDDATDDTTVYLGDGVTITDIIKSGGELDLNSNTTSLEQTAGNTTIHAGAHTLLNIFDGSLNYNSVGTLSEINLSGASVLIFDQDRRPKTVTIINKLSDASQILDVSGSIANPVIDMENIGDLSTLDMGKNFKLTFGATT